MVLGERPAISATLNSRAIDLGQLLPPAQDSTEAPEGPYVFPEEALPLAALKALEMDLDIRVGALRRESLVLRDVLLLGKATGGNIDVRQQASGPNDGTFQSHLQLHSDASTLKATLRSKLRDIRLNIASGEDIDPSLIPPHNLTVTLSSKGASPRQLAAASQGHLHLTMGSGKVKNNAVGAFTGDILTQLFRALNPLAEKEAYTDFECGLALVDIEDGVARFGETLLQTRKLMIVGGGRINLNNERLNLEFNTKPREGLGLSADMFVTPFVALKGTLRQPHLGLNEKGALLTGGAAVATGGLSLLVTAALDRATAAIDHCKNTLPKYPHPDID